MLRPYAVRAYPLAPYGQHRHPSDRLPRSLGVKIERPQRQDLVAPPLDSRRRRHAEAVHIEDAAAHAELRHLGHGRYARVAHLAQPAQAVTQWTPFPLPLPRTRLQDHAPGGQGGGYPRPLRRRPGGRDENAHPRPEQRLQRFDPLPRNLEMGFLGAQRLALRVQRGRLACQRRHVREPALRVGSRRGDAHEDPLRQLPGERADEHGRGRSRESGHGEPRPGWEEPLHQRPGIRELGEAVEQKVERHQRLMEATASSMAASRRAKPSSKPLTSARRVAAKRSAASPASSSTRAPGKARRTSSGVAGVRSDSRGSGPNTVAPTVSAPRVKNCTRGAPTASATGASPRAIRFASASTNGTKPGAPGRAVQVVSRRLPSRTTPPSRTSHGSPLTLATTPESPSVPSSRYRRFTCTPRTMARSALATVPGGPGGAKCQRTPRAASARFTCPRSAGSPGGNTMLRAAPSRSPIAISPPTTTRLATRSTASAADRNGPTSASAVTLAGAATRTTNSRRSSPRSSSASSSTSPIHHPGASGGSGSVTDCPGAASVRPTSRARAGALPGGCTRATRSAALAPGVPETAIVSPPSPARAAAMPRLAGTRAGGASTSSATPGTSTFPAPSAVRCRSLSTWTSRAGRGSAATRRAAPPTAGTRSRRCGVAVAPSTLASSASREPARATPSASTSQRRSPGAAWASDARASVLSRSSTGRPSTTALADNELSSTTASAVGACTAVEPLPLPPLPPLPPPTRVGKIGRAAASTITATSAVRGMSSSRWRSRRRRAP